MRVLLIVDRYGRGGTAVQVAKLAEALLDRGIDVKVLVLFHKDRIQPGLRFDVSRVDYLELDNLKPLNLIRAVLRVRRRALMYGADLLHGFLSEGNIVACLAGFAARRPSITSHRDLGIDSPRLVLLNAWLERLMAAAITANSRAAAEAAASRAGFRSDQIFQVNNIVEPARPSRSRSEVRTELGLEPGATVVVSVGFLRALKGHEDLLQAIKLVSETNPAVRLLLVGRVTQTGYEALLRRLAVELQIESRVGFLGERDDVADILGTCDLFVLPSRTESVSNALLEAQAAGLPVIATAVGGSREVIADGTNGLLVPPAEPAVLAGAIRRVLSNPQLASDLGQSGRRSAQEGFRAEAAAGQLLSIYREVLAIGSG